jgi:hypothetical protein
MASWAAAYDQDVSQVTQEQFCQKQVSVWGMDPQLCAQRYQAYQLMTRGKGQKAYSRWAHGKGTAY